MLFAGRFMHTIRVFNQCIKINKVSLSIDVQLITILFTIQQDKGRKQKSVDNTVYDPKNNEAEK